MTLAAAATDEHTSEGATESEGEGEAGTESAQEGVSCHFHAGVEYVYLCIAIAIVRRLT